MKSRGWKQKLAKSRGIKQSLFEHSLLEFDVLLELLPILAKTNHYNLSEIEQKLLLVSVLAHDVGKETSSWQEYIKNPKPECRVSHIFPELTELVVSDLYAVLGFDEISTPVQRIMAHCANFHHSRPGRGDATILEAMLTGGSDRFLTLAHLVRGIDYFCSATEAYEAVEAMPAKDMVKTVDFFWSLPGYAANHPEAYTVGELPDNGRLETLIEILGGIAEKVYRSIPRQSPRQELSQSMANPELKGTERLQFHRQMFPHQLLQC